MEGQGGGGEIELLADAARGETIGAGFHQQPVHRQARRLCQCGERVDRLRHFHVSRIMETTARCQARCQPRSVWLNVSAATTLKSLPLQP